MRWNPDNAQSMIQLVEQYIEVCSKKSAQLVRELGRYELELENESWWRRPLGRAMHTGLITATADSIDIVNSQKNKARRELALMKSVIGYRLPTASVHHYAAAIIEFIETESGSDA